MAHRLKSIFSRLRGQPKKTPAPIGAADVVVEVVLQTPLRVARARGEDADRADIAARVSARKAQKFANITAARSDSVSDASNAPRSDDDPAP